jgi:hypothetical protein
MFNAECFQRISGLGQLEIAGLSILDSGSSGAVKV